ncbi:TlpA family protein disulfide reductase [Aureivirga sp. CE67]|uniref:TlpA family protein disulfide reductase n=1 Tax=Aureivirga sp. CE67 TaxID=1788983 RepID=UPI0018CBBCB5|nr:TlpA disulfide reductase family protein [Aureivirga sp. CE67]
MKKLTVLIAAFAVFACSKETKDYTTLKGKIENKNSDTIVVRGKDYEKKILLDQDGSFMDTLHVKSAVYTLFDGKEATLIYLKDGYDVQVNINAKDFVESVKYTGEGANANNVLAEKIRIQKKYLNDDSIFDLNRDDFDKTKSKINSELSALIVDGAGLDSAFIADEKKNNAQLGNYLEEFYKQKEHFRLKFPKGSESPQFVDYEDFKGGKKSLEDFKGKYVYIDIWATWCGPCIKEIPSLKEVEKKYHDKNITFLSISVDSERDYEKWKKMVADENLGGVQLIANPSDQKFLQDYMVSSIPRFILLDPDGNIVSADAPRPSSEKLIEIFKNLNI